MSGLRKTLRSVPALRQAGLIDASEALHAVAARYAIAITPTVADLIERDTAHDPIARQFVPSEDELVVAPEERADPIGDDAHQPVEGVVHRYPDRVLLKLVHVCPVYCRFCFRREMVGPGKRKALSPAELDVALDYIRSHDAIWEVILTGGDPLILSPRKLRGVMQALAAIDHVKIVRIHTRVPTVAPERITATLTRALKIDGKATYVVLHANHVRELSAAARQACARLIDAGLPMLSQSVLLKGVNDDAATLEALLRGLVEIRIKPYYLHHADLAPGTSAFRTSIDDGQALMRTLRGRVSGLCQPTYVLDIPGGAGKMPIGPNYLENQEDGRRTVRDNNGAVHAYPPPLSES
jgi:lysine 2,3-aminomutase